MELGVWGTVLSLRKKMSKNNYLTLLHNISCILRCMYWCNRFVDVYITILMFIVVSYDRYVNSSIQIANHCNFIISPTVFSSMEMFRNGDKAFKCNTILGSFQSNPDSTSRFLTLSSLSEEMCCLNSTRCQSADMTWHCVLSLNCLPSVIISEMSLIFTQQRTVLCDY